jgi:GDP-4-dehydro-6-deoxy-D-mannose reductase
MDKNILVTGASGFVGAHLIKYLLEKNSERVFGTYLEDSSLEKLSEFKNKVELEKIDLLDKDKVSGLIDRIKPDAIYHLAALTSPSLSFESPAEFIMNNISSEINILESLKSQGLTETKLLVVSSGDVYGKVKKEDLPIDEETPFNPTNPYAVSKIAQDFLGLQYFLAYGIKIVRVRPFNHTGPGQSPNFVVPAFSKKIAEIEKGKREPVLQVGNLKGKRDFTDVRDMIRAYDLILNKGVAGDVYNIGSGKSYVIGDILSKLLALSKKKIKIETDKSLLIPMDNPELTCDYSKLSKLTGWKPEIPIEKTLQDTLDYWRNIL